jgi:hypothetical protein
MAGKMSFQRKLESRLKLFFTIEADLIDVDTPLSGMTKTGSPGE